MFDQELRPTGFRRPPCVCASGPRRAAKRSARLCRRVKAAALSLSSRRPSGLAALRQALDGSIVFTHGFGIEGQLIFHWICERDLDIEVVMLDTGRLFPETYTLWRRPSRVRPPH